MMTPIRMNMYSQNTVLYPEKYTNMLAAMKAIGHSSHAAGSRKTRGRSGSRLRSAASVTGANEYMMTVAEVTRPTRPDQLGNGRNTSTPMTKQMPIDTSGTPRRSILLIAEGK